MSSDRVDDRLQDILDNIEAIEGYVGPMSNIEFAENRLALDACERCLQRITEAAIKIGSEMMVIIAPDIPLYILRGLGNALRHEYDRIDATMVYDTIRRDLPKLRIAVSAHLKGHASS